MNYLQAGMYICKLYCFPWIGDRIDMWIYSTYKWNILGKYIENSISRYLNYIHDTYHLISFGSRNVDSVTSGLDQELVNNEDGNHLVQMSAYWNAEGIWKPGLNPFVPFREQNVYRSQCVLFSGVEPGWLRDRHRSHCHSRPVSPAWLVFPFQEANSLGRKTQLQR